MGIFIDLYIAEDVTDEEWAPVYEESLKLARAFHLMDSQAPEMYGHRLVCGIPSGQKGGERGCSASAETAIRKWIRWCWSFRSCRSPAFYGWAGAWCSPHTDIILIPAPFRPCSQAISCCTGIPMCRRGRPFSPAPGMDPIRKTKRHAFISTPDRSPFPRKTVRAAI